MKVLIAYPNLPMMLIPAVSVGIFTTICRDEGVDVRLFETTAYTNDPSLGMLYKTKIGGGRSYTPEDLGMDLKPTNEMIPDFISFVEEYEPDLVLFSTVEDTFNDTVEMIDSIEHLNIPHIVGGVFPINAPEICINHPSIKAICRFEGEIVLREVLQRMNEGKPWSDVPGIWTKSKRNIMAPLCDINDVIPDYHLYHPARFNRAMGGKVVRSINVETYRGCPYKCTFCNSPMTRAIDNGYLRRKSIDTVKRELDSYMKYQPDYWFFIDDSFAARPRKELFELCKLLEEYKVPWWCNTRIETVDEEILAAMKQGHCGRIQFGIESGNEDYRRDVLWRPISNEEYEKKIPAINESGIPYGLNVIIGLPHETREMVEDTIELVRKFAGYDGLGISIFIPYHGTQLRNYAIQHELMDPDWISSDGYLIGGSCLKQSEEYLQPDEIVELTKKFKYYAFWPRSEWDAIDKNPEHAEVLYNVQFYTPFASNGRQNIIHRTMRFPTYTWGCEADENVHL